MFVKLFDLVVLIGWVALLSWVIIGIVFALVGGEYEEGLLLLAVLIVGIFTVALIHRLFRRRGV